ncbi:MAG: outer membrane protein OmpA-like peptidoglycan-associated protein [Verrucomicrobiales bacterium]|jgi:outer membrane protein OmpA-like peptidoglycan-associated protein/DNA repair exonuclease SbcCD ATPase subunit
MRKNRAIAMVWVLVAIVLGTGTMVGQDASTDGKQVSAQEFRAELARAQSDIELLRRALRRKQDAEKLAMECREELRTAEAKLDRLSQESTAELAQRANRVAALEARVQETTQQLEEKGSDSTAADLEKLKGELDAKISELMAAQKNAGRLATMLEAAVKETEQLRKARGKSGSELAEARKALEALTKKSGEDKKALEEEKKKLTAEKADLDKKLADAEKKKKELTKSVEKHKSELVQARKDLNSAFALMKRDRKLKEKAEAKIVAQMSDLTVAKKTQAESEKAIAKLNAEKEAALTEISELKRKLHDRNHDRASKERIELLEKQVAKAAALTDQHEKLKREKDKAIQELINAGTMIQQLMVQRKDAQAKLESAVATQKEAEGKAEKSLSATLEKALAEKLAAEKERDSLRKQVTSDQVISKEIKAACEQAEKNLAKLKEELSTGNKVADSLGGKLRSAAETLAKLRDEKAAADKEIAALADQLEAQRHSYESQLAAKDAELNALQGRLAEAQAGVDSRQNAFVDAGAYINQLLLEQKGEQRSRVAAERALTEAGEVIRELLAGQDRFKSQLSDARQMLTQEKSKGGAAGRTLANAEGRIRSLEKQLAMVTSRLKESQSALTLAQKSSSNLLSGKLSVESTLKDTADMLGQVVEKQNGQQVQLADLDKLLQAEKSNRSVEQKALMAARDQVSKLTVSLEQQKKATSDAARNATTVAAVLATLKTEKGSADRKLAELAASLEAANAANAALTTKFDTSEQVLAERTAELKKLRVDFKELESQRGIAKEALEESNKVIRDLLAAKDACDLRIAELTASSDKQKSELASVRSEMKTEKDARKAALVVKAETEKQLATLTKELEARRQALDAANAATQQLSVQLKSLTGDRESLTGERETLQAALAAELKRVSELQGHLARLREEVAKRTDDVGKLDALLVDAESKGNETKETLLGSAVFLKSLLSKRAAEQKDSAAAQQKLLAETEKLRADFTNELQARDSTIAEGRKSIQSLAAAAQEVQEQKVTFEGRASDLKSELEKVQKRGLAESKLRAEIGKELASARARIAVLEDKAAEIDHIRSYTENVKGTKLQAEAALKDAATFISELLDLRTKDTTARRAAEKALLKLKGDFEGVEKQAEELRRKLNDLDELKVKRKEAEDHLARLEQERERSSVATDSALTVVQQLSGARVEAISAQQNAESAFHEAALELDRLRFEITRKEQEFRMLLSEKEMAFEQQLNDKQQMLVIANTRLGEVDNRLQMAIDERKNAESAAEEATDVLSQLRTEKVALDQQIGTLNQLVEEEKTARVSHADDVAALKRKLIDIVMERDRIDVARLAAEKNALAMGELLAKQSEEIETSKKLAEELVAMKGELEEATMQRDYLAIELDKATLLNSETIALKEKLVNQESACQNQLEMVLAKMAEREKQVNELESASNDVKVLHAELAKLKGEGNAALHKALAEAASFQSKVADEKQKAIQYQQALEESEGAVANLAGKVKSVDTAYSGALTRIKELESALGKARDDKANALRAALDVKAQLLRIDPIWYALNSASIEDEQARILKQAKSIIAQYPTAKFTITGHTCAIGSLESNKRLSQSRAKGLADFLIKNGIAGDSIGYKGIGPAQPIGDNATEAGRRRNRRVEVDAVVPE